MRRFELYVGNNDRLVLSEFKEVESEYESRIFKGKETYEIIRRLASSKLVDFSELRRGNDLILEYKNKIPVISEKDRMEIIKSIKYVDEVVWQKNMDKVDAIKKYNGGIIR